MEHELAGRLAGGPVAGKEHEWKAAVGQQERRTAAWNAPLRWNLQYLRL